VATLAEEKQLISPTTRTVILIHWPRNSMKTTVSIDESLFLLQQYMLQLTRSFIHVSTRSKTQIIIPSRPSTAAFLCLGQVGYRPPSRMTHEKDMPWAGLAFTQRMGKACWRMRIAVLAWWKWIITVTIDDNQLTQPQCTKLQLVHTIHAHNRLTSGTHHHSQQTIIGK